MITYLDLEIALTIPNKHIRQVICNKLERNDLVINFQSGFWYIVRGSLSKTSRCYLEKLWKRERGLQYIDV